MFSSLLTLATAVILFAPPEVAPPIEPAEQPIEQVAPRPPSVEFETFEGDPIGVEQIVLDNGLTVLLSENHERPEVFGAVVVRTGGKNDPADNTGMAHYLEHMLFKGTKSLGTSNWAAEEQLQAQIIELYEQHERATTDAQRARLQADIGKTVEQTYAYVIPNELDRMLEEIGGSGVNAFTTEDETVYYNTFPTSQIDTWLQIYAHRFSEPVFRLFPTELEAVYEEKNISLDRFEVRLYETFIRRAFPDHPYGTQSVLGEIEHLKQPSLVAMRAYFDEYYVANNMALVLSGDFDAQAIMPVIEAQFGAWRRGPEPEPRGGTVAPFEGRELVKLRLTPVRVGAYGFRTVPPRHPDYAALQVVRELLFNDQGSGYIDNLVDEGKILIALPFMQEFADHGLDIVFFAPRILGQTFKSAERQILEQYRRIARGEFDEQRMLAIRDGLRRAEDRKWEDNEARALALADSFIRRDSWGGYLDYRERLATLTREDVMRVAATLFGDDYLAMRSRLGFPKKTRLSKPHYPAVSPVAGAHSAFYEQVMAQTSPAAELRYVDFEADVTTTSIGAGVVLRTNENPFNDTYTLDLRFGVGTDEIREIGVATEYIDRVGTRDHSPTEFREALSLLGTTFTTGATLDETVVRVTGPEQQLPAALELLDAMLREPVADRKRSKALRRERAGYERVQRRDPSYVAGALREYVMYGERSDYLRDYGRKGLRKLSDEQLLAAWQRAQSYALEIRYTGQRAPAEVAELLGGALQLDGPREPAVEHVVRPRVMPANDTVFFLPRRKAIQTQLVFLVDGEAVSRDQLAAADAYDEYMGGSMAGLVFQEIREFRALAYSASGRFARDDNPAQAGYFVGGIGCQADKTAEAIAVMMGLIREMPAKPERVEAMRSSLCRGLETQSPGFRELQRTLVEWRRRGYEADPREWLLKEYAQLSFADIEAFHAAQVADRPVMLLVVGDPRRVDTRDLERYGEVVEVHERQLFAR
ncbi:M16 family metallopeptidase [Enhygromyxa salina]|uniref:Protease 3 n=1 Tax=Enhygromyxa salina TaxID=215803 RepID=A0A2S9YWF5_9BACT|nr:M16 family metallopeptidase [Enhygromyxa salina]PRQ09379.1 Protease 3 precursor [Enhygromyxa salina]